MYVRTYVRMYVGMYVCMYVCMYICMHANVHVHMSMCMTVYIYVCTYVYICVYVYGCIYMVVLRNSSLSRSPRPLLQTFVAGPLVQTLVVGLCVEYCSLQQACRREGFSQHPSILLQALSQKGRPGLLQARCF